MYAFRAGCGSFPDISSVMVTLLEGVNVDDSVFGAGCWSMQFNATGKKYWHQVVVQVYKDGAHFSLWQFDPKVSLDSPAWWGGAEFVGNFSVSAGSHYIFAFKDDGTALWGSLSVYDSQLGDTFSTGWVQLENYDQLDVLSFVEAGAGGGSVATFSTGSFLNVLQTPQVQDLKAYAIYLWGDVPVQTPPCTPYVGTAEQANLEYKITNSNEITPGQGGFEAVHVTILP